MDDDQEMPKENLSTDIVAENNECDPLVSNHEPETKVSEVNA